MTQKRKMLWYIMALLWLIPAIYYHFNDNFESSILCIVSGFGIFIVTRDSKTLTD